MILGFLAVAMLGASPKVELKTPRLGVVLVIDQLGSADLEMLTMADFGGLGSRGARFDAWYNNLSTETAPGHATLSTGSGPSTHGICANEWAADGKTITAVDDPGVQVLGAKPGIGKSARFLEAPTLGDTLKARSPLSRVIAISQKDRSAILMGGPSADLTLWYEMSSGRFTTSSAWATELPEWARALADLPSRSFATAQWSPLKDGGASRLEDGRAGEATPNGFSARFPHDLKSLPEASRAAAYRLTPSSVEDLFKLALAAIDAEQLGKRGATDLLWVSVSAVDYAGHNWGPGSAEKVDLLERLSAEIRALMRSLDTRLGKNGWAMVVSSDHGIAPLPDQTRPLKLRSGRVSTQTLIGAARAGAGPKLAPRVLSIAAPHVYLDEVGLSADDKVKLRAGVRQGLSTVPGVRIPREDDPLAIRANYLERCGTVLFDLAPFFVFAAGYDAGTDHSSGNAYDRRVPLFVVGPSVRPSRNFNPVEPQDVAPTLAALLGIPPPDRSEGKPVLRFLPP